jgi:hypothetical protein
MLLTALPLVLALGSGPVSDTRDWCDQHGGDDQARHCDVREIDLGAVRSVSVDAEPNGGIAVEGVDGTQARLWVKVEGRGATDEEARALASQVRIETDGTIRATGPQTRGRRGWHASFRLQVPRATELRLTTGNGGITLRNTTGVARLDAVNGGLHLAGLGGQVDARTVNGGVHLSLTGDGWSGDGLEATTTNGGLHVEVDETYRARLQVSTVNGRMKVGFPVTLQGSIGKTLSLDLAGGGPELRIRTTNGSVSIDRP